MFILLAISIGLGGKTKRNYALKLQSAVIKNEGGYCPLLPLDLFCVLVILRIQESFNTSI